MTMLVGKKAPAFKAAAVVNGGDFAEEFSLEQYIGKKHVLFFFYPLDFMNDDKLLNGNSFYFRKNIGEISIIII